MIQEVIVVEGRDDESAVKRAVEAEVIVTNGYGINDKILSLIKKAHETNGIILFTDPDYAGETIRKKLAALFPGCKHAHLPREEATENGDIGIENASPENIRNALEKAHVALMERRREFTAEDLMRYQLTGNVDAAANRHKLGQALGIGYCNGKTLLNRLNNYGITRKEVEEALYG